MKYYIERTLFNQRQYLSFFEWSSKPYPVFVVRYRSSVRLDKMVLFDSPELAEIALTLISCMDERSTFRICEV